MNLVLEAAAEKKAEDAVALDLRKVAAFTDAFVICSGAQRRQTQAICDAVVERMEAAGERVGHLEGYDRGDWILLDLSDLVVHVFTPETRRFYGLERLWGDAPRLDPAAPAATGVVARPRTASAPRKPGARRTTRKG